MRHFPVPFAVGLTLCVETASVHALGFGRVVNPTQLGQPLDFTAQVQLGADETLTRECVEAEVISGETRLQPGQFRVTLEPGRNPDERSVRVTSFALIDEPVVSVSVTIGCESKMSRKFIAFVDPPPAGPSGQAVPTIVLERPTPQRVESEVAPLLAAAEAASRSGADRSGDTVSRRARSEARFGAGTGAGPGASTRATGDASRAPASTRVAPTTPADAPAAADESRFRKPVVARAAKPPSGPRLRLEAPPIALAQAGPARPAPAAVASASSAAPSQILPPAAAAAASQTAAEAAAELASHAALATAQLAARALAQAELNETQQARIQQLEASMTRLANETSAAQARLGQVQARLQAAEAERTSAGVVYALAGLCGALTIAVALLWRRALARRGSERWWSNAEGARAAGSETTAAARGGRPSAADVFDLEDDAADVQRHADAPDDAMLSSTTLPAAASRDPHATDVFASAPRGPRIGPPLVDVVLDTSGTGFAHAGAQKQNFAVEELIDLAQQVEFFIVLGQDDAAVDLLNSHLRGHGAGCPMPYLELLEIHRRRGDREAYDRVRERVGRRFGVDVPGFDVAAERGRSLFDYAETSSALQALWSRPLDAMRSLDAALCRRGAQTDVFDLPAYRELLFLYSIARDLAEHDGASLEAEEGGGVDLLLPLDVPAAPVPPVARSVPTLDLDISVVALGPRHRIDGPPALSVRELESKSAFAEFQAP